MYERMYSGSFFESLCAMSQGYGKHVGLLTIQGCRFDFTAHSVNSH